MLPDTDVNGEGLEVATLRALPGLLDPQFTWTLRPTREIETVADDSSDPLVFDPRSLLELSNRTLLIHDPQADQVLVLLDTDRGELVRRFGRGGQGPDELGRLLYFAETDQGFAVLDASNHRIHRYALAGDPISRSRLDIDVPVRKAMASGRDGGFLVELFRASDAGWHREFAHVDALTGSVEFVARLPDPPSYAEPGVTQRGRDVWTALGNEIVAMWSDRPIVTVRDLSGALVREVELPMSRHVLDGRDIQQQIDHYGSIARRLEEGPAPLTNELYSVGDTIFAMFTSDLHKFSSDPPLPVGRVWWRLFTVRGEYVGVAPLPEDFRPLGVSKRGVWARVLDDAAYPLIQELELAREDSS